jgi:hypothetical protein
VSMYHACRRTTFLELCNGLTRTWRHVKRPCLEHVPSSTRHVYCKRHVASTDTTSSHHAKPTCNKSMEMSCCTGLQLQPRNISQSHSEVPSALKTQMSRRSTVDCYNWRPVKHMIASLSEDGVSRGPQAGGCSDSLSMDLDPLLHRLHGRGTQPRPSAVALNRRWGDFPGFHTPHLALSNAVQG